MLFVYDDWNREHVTKHGVMLHDAKFVIDNARPPYPKKIEEGKFIVYGKDRHGRMLEVVFALKRAEEIGHNSLDFLQAEELTQRANTVGVYIIHAMPVAKRKQPRRRR